MAAKKPPAKKASKKPAKVSRGTPSAKEKLDAMGIEEVCEAIARQETLTGIAQKAGVSIASLLAWLDADPERSARAREVRAGMAKVWDEKAEQELRLATSPLDLARAKELAHHYRWRASKISPQYGDKVEVSGNPVAPVRHQHEVTMTPVEAYRAMKGGE